MTKDNENATTGFGLLLLCASWASLAYNLHEYEPALKAILEGLGIQFLLTLFSVIVYSVSCVIPYFGNVVAIGLALIGSYYFPQMTATFICTAVGICFILFNISGPDKK